MTESLEAPSAGKTSSAVEISNRPEAPAPIAEIVESVVAAIPAASPEAPPPEAPPPTPPRKCPCFCGACSRGDHVNCSNASPCPSECGCRCASCKRGDHPNCSHANPCVRFTGKREPVALGNVMTAPTATAETPAAIAVPVDPMPPPLPSGPPEEGAAAPGAGEGRVAIGVLGRAVWARLDRLERALSELDATEDRSIVLLELAEGRGRFKALFEQLSLVERATAVLLTRREQ